MKIGIRELKARAPQVVREVRERGERVDITYRGQVVAHLSPAEDVHRVDFETAWKEFQAVARAVGKRTTKKRGRRRTPAEWRRDL